ncbi:MAG: hypothetical protein J6L99_03220 [Ruminococcus sp.]|nr:hypothetical protein [Ruminococcus sp.]
MLPRRMIFVDLIKGIFNSGNVRFIDNKSCIATDGTQVSDAEYNIYARQKFTDLLVEAYINRMKIVKSSNSKPGNEYKISYEHLISNTIIYFSNLGYDMDEKQLKIIGENVLGKFFCYAITEKILPFVFDGNDPDKNAESDFKQVKWELTTYFNGFDLGYIVHNHAKNNDVETVMDSMYKKKDKDLYAVPIDRSKIEYEIILPFSEVKISIGIQPDESERFTLERIIGNYQKYPFADDEPFLDPFAGQVEEFVANNPKYTEESCFPLSDVVIPTQYFIPRYFYYITCINQEIIDRYNGEEKRKLGKPLVLTDGSLRFPTEDDVNREFERVKLDHENLNTLLTKRAAKDFREKYHDDVSEYYHHVMVYIEDMIRRIATIDYSYAIRRDSDVDACQKFARHFNIDYVKMIEFIEDDDCVKKCYELIEEAVYEFTKKLNSVINPFAILKLQDEFKKFLPHKVEAHYNKIGEYIESGKLINALRLKAKILSDNPDADLKIEMPVRDENGHITISETFRIMGEYEKTGNIYMEIYNILKQYHDSFKK